MSRILVIAVLLAGLTMAAFSLPAQAPADAAAAQKPAAKEKAAVKDAPLTPRSLVTALTSPATFPGVDDPKSTLSEVLDRLGQQNHVTFDINERAFKYEMLNDVAKTEIANPNPIPAMKTTLAKVLARVLARVPVPSGATFLVRDDCIEITTGTFVAVEVTVERRQPPKNPRSVAAVSPMASPAVPGLGGGFGALGGGLGALGGGAGMLGGVAPTLADEDDAKKFSVAVVSVAVERQPLDEALRQIRLQSSINIVLDPGLGEKSKNAVSVTLLNAPVDSAVRVLTEMTELDYVWLDNIFYIATREKAQKLRASWPGRRSGGGTPVITGAGGGAGGAGM